MKLDKGLDGRGVYRAIYCSIWNDVDFQKLTPEEKLVFLNLRTSPLTNMPVIYPFYVEAIERQTGLDREKILKVLDTLSDTHWIAIEKGIVWVKKGLRFDPNITLANEKHLTAIKNIILTLPKLKIVRDFLEFYQIDIPYLIPYAIPYAIPYVIPYAIQDPDPDPEPEPEPEKEKEEDIKGKEKPNLQNPSSKPFFSSKGKIKIKPKKPYCADVALSEEEKQKRWRGREDAKKKGKTDLEQLRRDGLA